MKIKKNTWSHTNTALHLCIIPITPACIVTIVSGLWHYPEKATVLHEFVKPLHNLLQVLPSKIVLVLCVDLYYVPTTSLEYVTNFKDLWTMMPFKSQSQQQYRFQSSFTSCIVNCTLCIKLNLKGISALCKVYLKSSQCQAETPHN